MAGTKQEVKHTALPWRTFQAGSEGVYLMPDTGDKRQDLKFIAIFNGRNLQEDLANAELAKRAVNSHALLVEALEAIAIALKDPAGGEYWTAREFLDKQKIWHGDIDGEKVLLEVAKAALQAAAQGR